MPFNTKYSTVEYLISQLVSGNAERAFTMTSRSFYAETALRGDLVDEIMIGLNGFNAEGGHDGTFGEFGFKWKKFGDDLSRGSTIACRFHIYDDAWRVLPLFDDLIAILPTLEDSNDPRMVMGTPTPDMISDILIRLGIQDRTKAKRP